MKHETVAITGPLIHLCVSVIAKSSQGMPLAKNWLDLLAVEQLVLIYCQWSVNKIYNRVRSSSRWTTLDPPVSAGVLVVWAHRTSLSLGLPWNHTFLQVKWPGSRKSTCDTEILRLHVSSLCSTRDPVRRGQCRMRPEVRTWRLQSKSLLQQRVLLQALTGNGILISLKVQ